MSDADLVAALALATLALLAAFFAVRPELWKRLFLQRVDPRPAGLLRVAFGLVVLWTFLDLAPVARFLFTDEGLWLTDMARARYGGVLAYLWDPELGFEHWWSPLHAALSMPTVLHLRSDPPFVFALYSLLVLSGVLVVLGVWTRWTTIALWILTEQFYGYSSVFYIGGDFVVRAFLFLGMLSSWGEAYSLDSYRRRRRAIVAGGRSIPPLRRIPAWPLRLMMLQLVCIYCTSGLLKTGAAWRNGTALYYALNNDHFYRIPAQAVVTWLQFLGILPTLTWVTRWWEVLFPLALVGAVLRAFERDRESGVWPFVPSGRRWLSYGLVGAVWLVVATVAGLGALRHVHLEMLPFMFGPDQLRWSVTIAVALMPLPVVAFYRLLRRRVPSAFGIVLNWVLGKRVWLVFGLLLHVGIDAGINVGIFSQAMIATYLAWLSGREIDGFWRFMRARRASTYVVRYHPDERSVRRAALLRIWDIGRRLEFVADVRVPPMSLNLDIVRGSQGLVGAAAALALARIFPGLWWLRLGASIPRLSRPAGALALRLLGQA
jgi:hypothetical protein